MQLEEIQATLSSKRETSLLNSSFDLSGHPTAPCATIMDIVFDLLLLLCKDLSGLADCTQTAGHAKSQQQGV